MAFITLADLFKVQVYKVCLEAFVKAKKSASDKPDADFF